MCESRCSAHEGEKVAVVTVDGQWYDVTTMENNDNNNRYKMLNCFTVCIFEC